MDDSAALIGAAVKAFTPYESTKDYLTSSFNKLNSDAKTPKEPYIRLDTSHFVKIVYNLSCFQNVDSRVKAFYCKCILFIKSLDSYDRLKDVIADVITVCLHKFINTGSRCETAIKTLKNIIKANKEITDTNSSTVETEANAYSIFNETIISNGHSSEDTLPLIEVTNVPKWYRDDIDKTNLLVSLADDDEPGCHENLFYMPSFIRTLTRLVSQLPLWSNIMVTVYNSTNTVATSSNVESYFKTIKRYLCSILTKS